MNIVFQINGGAGKCVMATAVCKVIKKKYPESKLIVVSGHSEIFLNNPNVYKSLQFGTISYFYEDYIRGQKDAICFMHDPYVDKLFLPQNKHLIQVWCEMFGLTYNGEMPEIFLTPTEVDFYQRNIKTDKPIMLLHTNGGGDVNTKYSWARDIPAATVIDVINHYKQDYVICHIRREDQIRFKDTASVYSSYREIMALCLKSSKRLLIDSMVQHFCAAFRMQSVVCWIANKSNVFGYNLHINIQANPFTTKPALRNAFLTEFNIGGDPTEFAYNNESEIFDTASIISAIDAQK